MSEIDNYKQIPVGRGKDYSNQRIGDFLIFFRTEPPKDKNPNNAYWLCQCQKCKKYEIIQAPRISKGIMKCSCRNDLTGKTFGRWTVQYLCEQKTKKRGNLWHCKCLCGNEKDVPAETLARGESQSCGCLHRESVIKMCHSNRINLTGQRFGKLIALYPIYSKEKNTHTKWHCKCDCGNECDIDMGNLRSGKSQSCGCTNSKQEEKIIKLLIENNISFNYQDNNFLDKSKKFDFYIKENLNEYIIEFDGQQHFFYTGTGWDTKEHYERTHKNDLIKNKYCFDNSIPLIRIPYDAEYTIDDLRLETTRFLLTPENEEEYYSKRM